MGALTGCMQIEDSSTTFSATIAPLLLLLLAVLVSADSEPQICIVEGDACKMANQEQTFIMIKPDGVARGLVGEVIKRFEQKVLLGCNLLRLSPKA